jgi:type 1 glutamine amidotransferase
MVGFVVALGCACSSGGSDPAPSSGASGGSSGSSGSSGGHAGGGGANATGGSGGASSGGSGAGGSGSGGTTATTGGAGGAAQGGNGGGGSSGTPDGGSDAGPATDGAGADAGTVGPARVLFFTATTGTTHVAAITKGVAAVTDLLKTKGIDADMSADPSVWTAANLAKYSGVVLISTSGKPFGTPGTAQIAALVDFVKKGGGLAGFHAASSAMYEPTGPFAMLIGGVTAMTGNFIASNNCVPQGDNPSVKDLPNPFVVRDEEYYTFTNLNPANQVVLQCDSGSGAKLPIAWVRQEGAGRVFFTGLGHGAPVWSGQFLMDHAWPAILWTIGR